MIQQQTSHMPSRSQDFPVVGLVRYIWQQRIMLIALSLIVGLLWASWGVLNLTYTGSAVFQQRAVTTQGITISSGDSDVRFINSPNFARMVSEYTSWPVYISLSDRSYTEFLMRKLTDLAEPQPTVVLQDLTWRGDDLPSMLEVRRVSESEYEVRIPGVMEPRKVAFGMPFTTDNMTLRIDRITGPMDSVFELSTIGRERWRDALAAVHAVASGGSGSILRLSSSTNIIDLRGRAANPSQALWLIQQSKEAYVEFSRKRGLAPIMDGKTRLQENLNRNLRELEYAQEEAKELLSEYGVADFTESAQFIHDQMRRISQDIVTVRNEFITISEELTANHPAVMAMRNRLRFLERERVKLNNELSLLPEQRFTYQQMLQKSDLLKKHITANIEALADLDVQATATAGMLTPLGAPYLLQNDLFKIVLKRTGVAFLVSLVIGAGLLTSRFISNYLRHGFYVASARVRQLPVIADVAMPSMREQFSSVNSVLNALGAAQKAFHPISNAMRYLMDVASDKLILLTYHADAKNAALTTLSTAIYLARHSGKKICLIDADFANAHCTQMLKQNTDKGLVSLLLGKSNKNEVMRSILPDRFDFLPASQMPVNSGLLTQGQEFKNVLDDLRKEYDYVLVHMPPVNAWMHWYDSSEIKALIMQIVPLGIQPMQWYEQIERLPASVHDRLYLMFCRFKKTMLPASEI